MQGSHFMYLSLIHVSKRTKSITGNDFLLVNAEVMSNELYFPVFLQKCTIHYHMHTTEMSQ
jgi:hypothetical protein